MAGRRFDVADVVEVLQYWHAGRTERRLARSFGMGRNRVARIVAAATGSPWPLFRIRTSGFGFTLDALSRVRFPSSALVVIPGQMR